MNTLLVYKNSPHFLFLCMEMTFLYTCRFGDDKRAEDSVKIAFMNKTLLCLSSKISDLIIFKYALKYEMQGFKNISRILKSVKRKYYLEGKRLKTLIFL